jgi:hypothetical protein
VPNFRSWPIAVPDPEPKYRTDGYQVVQSNDGAIVIPRGEKERTFTVGVAPEVVPKAGLYQRGLLKSLMTWAIPTPTAEYSLKPVGLSLFHLPGFCRHLLVRLTPI